MSFHQPFTLCVTMDPNFPFPPKTPANSDDVQFDFYPLVRVFKDGTVERFLGTSTVPPGTDITSGVQSEDVVLSSEDGVGARLYLPKDASPGKKLPVLVYFHGGGFCVESAWSSVYHKYLNSVASKATVVVVSVNYRLAPEHVLPAAFEDSWSVLKWIREHSSSDSLIESEPWLKEYVDFNKIFLAGDSAGGNIVHNVGVRFGEEDLPGLKVEGVILIHPYFSGVEPIGNERSLPIGVLEGYENLWKMVYPGMNDLDDAIINPSKDMEKSRKVRCERVLVCIATKDGLASRGVEYGEVMKRCGKDVEVLKSEGMHHVFHLFDENEEVEKMMKKVVQFINKES